MHPFAFSRASTVTAALNAGARDGRYIAGGTTLVDLMRETVERPAHVVDINGLPYKDITVTRQGLHVGSLVRMSELAAHPEVRATYPLLSQALELGASAQLRNMASIGGNIMQRPRCPYFRDVHSACNRRDPGSGCDARHGDNRMQAILGTSTHCVATHPSDLAVALVALDAVVHVRGLDGSRSIPVQDFFLRPGDTPQNEHSLRPGELITSLTVPAGAHTRRSGYLKVRDRQSYEFALASAAVALDIRGGVVRGARVAVGGVATVPWRLPKVEEALVGKRPGRRTWTDAAALAATYSAEHRVEGLLYGVIVNGTVARGTVSRISVDAALGHPGVLRVLTDFRGLRLAHPVDRLAFYGQPIAVVVAETLEAATHGASLVEATYERQDAVTDFDAPDIPSQTPADEPDYSRGDPAGALASAQVKVDLELTSARENHNPIELPSTIARWQDGRLTLWDKTQWSQGAARTVAGALGIAVGDVRVHNEFVGGGFGSGIQTYDHVILAAFAAREVGRPVKVVLTRRQFYYGTGFRPASRHRMALGSSTAGRVSALVYEVRIENARYQTYTDGLTDLPQFLYGVPNTRTAYRVTPVDVQSPCSMRGPGVVLGNFALETAMDQLAHELAVDPVELRLRNEPTRDEVTQLPFSTRKLRECYETGARRFGWSRRHGKPGSRTDGDLLIGMGMATASYHNNRRASSARARMHADGTAEVFAASADMGPGTTTSVMQVAADALGLPASAVTFRLGDSSYPTAPLHAAATTMASVGSAAHTTCNALKAEFIRRAVADPDSPLHGANPADVHARGGYLSAADGGARDSYRDILRRAGLPSLEITGNWGPGDADSRISTYGYGAVFAEVSVDPLLGLVRVRRIFAAYDVGRVISPKLAHSQAIGGMVGGIGMALLEGTVTDHRDGRIVNASLADYLVPVNADVPELDAAFINTEDPQADPIGVKGLGEITIVGVAPAIGNAVFNATGKRLTDLPIRPEALL